MTGLREETLDIEPFRHGEIPAMPVWLLLVVKSATRKALDEGKECFSVAELSAALAEQRAEDIDPAVAADLMAMAGAVGDPLFTEPSWQGNPIVGTATTDTVGFQRQEP